MCYYSKIKQKVYKGSFYYSSLVHLKRGYIVLIGFVVQKGGSR